MKDRQKRRRALRLRGYDYSRAGAYFVTVCAADRGCLFGKVVGGEMVENRYAQITRCCWEDLPSHYPRVTLDAFVIMPNHVHGIIMLASGDDAAVTVRTDPYARIAPTSRSGDAGNAPIRHGLPEIMRALKTYSARRINALRGTPGLAVWQRGYYEHIIRDEGALRRIREYVVTNPQNWRKDREYGPER